jgi:hypothetical protein
VTWGTAHRRFAVLNACCAGGPRNFGGGSDAQNRLVRRRACDAHGGRSDCPSARNRQSAARGPRQANPSRATNTLATFAGTINQTLAGFAGRDGVALIGRDERSPLPTAVVSGGTSSLTRSLL